MKPLITCFGLVIIGALLLAPQLTHGRSFLDLERKSSGAGEKYAVVFDAGSSGTRIKVYKIQVHTPLRVSDVQQVPVPKPDKVKPGLSEFPDPDKVDQIRGYLRPLIDGALTVVPKDNQAETTIRLFATAGMRLLKDDERKRILDKVDDLLSDKNYCPFKYERGFSKVISGEDEAVYLWVTVNFLKGLFSGESSQSFGTLDLGGASTQNAFKIRYRKSGLPMVPLHISGKTYRVFAHSYLGYGEREARKLYFDKLVRKTIATKQFKNKGQKVYSPCHNKGFSTSITVDRIDYLVQGDFKNPRICQRYLRSLFFCPKCAFNTQPQLTGDFYSTSLFYYAFESTGIIQNHDEVVTLDKIDKTADSFCSKSVHKLDLKRDPWAYDRCFHLNYIEVMLVKGYRVNKKSFVLHNAGKLNGFDLNWTLGAALMSNQFLS